MSLLANLLGNVNIYDLALAVYKSQGREAAKRFLTPKESWVKSVCKKTGADPDASVEERNEAVDEILEFLESLIDSDFEDPDDE